MEPATQVTETTDDETFVDEYYDESFQKHMDELQLNPEGHTMTSNSTNTIMISNDTKTVSTEGTPTAYTTTVEQVKDYIKAVETERLKRESENAKLRTRQYIIDIVESQINVDPEFEATFKKHFRKMLA